MRKSQRALGARKDWRTRKTGGGASYNQNLWMHRLTGGATYLPL